VWGFQVCFVLPELFAALSFVALLLYWVGSEPSGKRLSWMPLVVSNLAALGASYSLANGNLLWPILIAAAILLRLRRAALGFVVTGVISTAFYLRHYQRPPWHADPMASLRMPAVLFEYGVGYLGSPWVHWGLRLAAPFGVAGLILALMIVLGFRRYRSRRQAFPIQLALILLFCAGTVFITALGRLNFGPHQSFASRYQTIALLFWCCLGLMALFVANESPQPHALTLAIQICLLALMARGAMRAHFPLDDARLHAFRLEQTATSLMTGVADEDNFMQAIGQPAHQLSMELNYLKREHLSVFSSAAYRQLGVPMESVFRLTSPDHCRGKLEANAALPEQSLIIRGWAWDNEHQRPPLRMVATVHGMITGLAAVGDKRQDVRTADPAVRSDFTGFAGYVGKVVPDAPVEVYVVLSEDPAEACFVGEVDVPK
jgi:hypothetical protein